MLLLREEREKICWGGDCPNQASKGRPLQRPHLRLCNVSCKLNEEERVPSISFRCVCYLVYVSLQCRHRSPTGSRHNLKYCMPVRHKVIGHMQSDVQTVCVCLCLCVYTHLFCKACLPGGRHAGFGNDVSMLTFSCMRSCPHKHPSNSHLPPPPPFLLLLLSSWCFLLCSICSLHASLSFLIFLSLYLPLFLPFLLSSSLSSSLVNSCPKFDHTNGQMHLLPMSQFILLYSIMTYTAQQKKKSPSGLTKQTDKNLKPELKNWNIGIWTTVLAAKKIRGYY